MQNVLLDYLTSLDNSSGETENWNLFKAKMLDLGFDTTSNSVIISQSTEREDIVCKENFKNNWLQEYFDKNYIEEDVMVSHCFQYTYPIILNSDKEADVSRWGSAQMIEGYRQAGMKRVISIPMRSTNAKLGGIITVRHQGKLSF